MRPGWQVDALCRMADPDLYDLDWVEAEWGISDWRAQDEYAAQMCAGCPVVRECALEALDPIDVADYALTPDGSSTLVFMEGVVRAGLALRSASGHNRSAVLKRLTRIAGREWSANRRYRRRAARVCVVCVRPFFDVCGWGVQRCSGRVCVFCAAERKAAA